MAELHTTVNVVASEQLQRLLFVHSAGFVLPGARDLSAAWQQIAFAVNKAPIDIQGVLNEVGIRLGFTPRALVDPIFLDPDPFNKHLDVAQQDATAHAPVDGPDREDR